MWSARRAICRALCRAGIRDTFRGAEASRSSPAGSARSRASGNGENVTMNTETFQIFCDVVHFQSFSRGAEANGISQSAATQSVHRLEKLLGAQLIDRAKRPLSLTPEGKICYEGFHAILETYNSVLSRIQASKTKTGGVIRVAAIYSIGLHDMSKCMREFMKKEPRTRIRLEFLHPDKVYRAVADSEADVGVISYPTPSSDLNVIPLRSEEMVVVAPAGHWFGRFKRVPIEELQDANFVAFDRDLPIRRETDRYLRQNNVRVNVVTEFDNIETIKQAIEVGMGISILPAPTVLDDIAAHKLVAVPFEGPKLTRPVGVIYRRRKIFTAAMTEFIELLGGALVKSNAMSDDLTTGNDQLDPNGAYQIEPAMEVKIDLPLVSSRPTNARSTKSGRPTDASRVNEYVKAAGFAPLGEPDQDLDAAFLDENVADDVPTGEPERLEEPDSATDSDDAPEADNTDQTA